MKVKELIKALRAQEGFLNKEVLIEGCDGCVGAPTRVVVEGKTVVIERIERS